MSRTDGDMKERFRVSEQKTDRGPYHPAKKVCERYEITDRTLDRWLENPKLDFPRPLIINKRRYFSDPELVAWERKRAANAA